MRLSTLAALRRDREQLCSTSDWWTGVGVSILIGGQCCSTFLIGGKNCVPIFLIGGKSCVSLLAGGWNSYVLIGFFYMAAF